MVAGPNALRLQTPLALEGHHMRHDAEFIVRAGEKVPFVLIVVPVAPPRPAEPIDPSAHSAAPPRGGRTGRAVATYDGEWRERRAALARSP